MSYPALAFALLAGFLFGLAYFACLWFSIRLLSKAPGWRAFAAGAAVRLAAVLAVLALVLRQDIEPAFILPGLLGFLAARLVVTAAGRHAARGEER